jgi:hypothetical protein
METCVRGRDPRAFHADTKTSQESAKLYLLSLTTRIRLSAISLTLRCWRSLLKLLRLTEQCTRFPAQISRRRTPQWGTLDLTLRGNSVLIDKGKCYRCLSDGPRIDRLPRSKHACSFGNRVNRTYLEHLALHLNTYSS